MIPLLTWGVPGSTIAVARYVIRRFDFSAAAFIIAFVLTKGAEENLRQALILTNDGWGIFLQRPVALLFFGIGFLAIAVRAWSILKKKPAVT